MVNFKQIFDDFQRGEIGGLYSLSYPSLITYAARVLTDECAFMAEDCVQDAIVECFARRESFESHFQFKAYLFACIHNRAVSMLRKSRSRKAYLQERQADSQAIEASMIEQDVLDLLFEAIEELPEKYREVFDLSFGQGLANAEVARLLSLSVDGVKKRKAKMIALLRERLGGGSDVQLLLAVLLMA